MLRPEVELVLAVYDGEKSEHSERESPRERKRKTRDGPELGKLLTIDSNVGRGIEELLFINN